MPLLRVFTNSDAAVVLGEVRLDPAGVPNVKTEGDSPTAKELSEAVAAIAGREFVTLQEESIVDDARMLTERRIGRGAPESIWAIKDCLQNEFGFWTEFVDDEEKN